MELANLSKVKELFNQLEYMQQFVASDSKLSVYMMGRSEVTPYCVDYETSVLIHEAIKRDRDKIVKQLELLGVNCIPEGFKK